MFHLVIKSQEETIPVGQVPHRVAINGPKRVHIVEHLLDSTSSGDVVHWTSGPRRVWADEIVISECIMND